MTAIYFKPTYENNQFVRFGDPIHASTYKDKAYCLFGKAHHDLQSLVQTQFGARISESLNDMHIAQETPDLDIEGLKNRLDLMHSPELKDAYDALELSSNQYNFKWESWSQLVSPSFYLKVGAYLINKLALKFWGLYSASSSAQSLKKLSTVNLDFHNTKQVEIGAVALDPTKPDSLTPIRATYVFDSAKKLHMGKSSEFYPGKAVINSMIRLSFTPAPDANDEVLWVETMVTKGKVKDHKYLVVTIDSDNQSQFLSQEVALAHQLMIYDEEFEKVLIRAPHIADKVEDQAFISQLTRTKQYSQLKEADHHLLPDSLTKDRCPDSRWILSKRKIFEAHHMMVRQVLNSDDGVDATGQKKHTRTVSFVDQALVINPFNLKDGVKFSNDHVLVQVPALPTAPSHDGSRGSSSDN